ncbi:unannotated protein [freshwater metagenome]|uniref:Unannotated protein n=1 Tax=freshwater metagenome TaxID=449393 RepID=A0A6J7N1R7_9ZZZZ
MAARGITQALPPVRMISEQVHDLVNPVASERLDAVRPLQF